MHAYFLDLLLAETGVQIGEMAEFDKYSLK